GRALGGGRYVVRGTLGEGAQGVTYDATTSDGRPVAIKRFDVRGARGWKDVELAEREARVLSTLDHPLVPRYVEHFEEDGALYLVMEKVEGETLEAIRRRSGPLPEDEVRRFLADADRALTYLHGRASPIVHRDIKPRNVVRRPNGSYVLVDFGAVSELLLRQKGGSTVVGTLGFMAPEQLQGRAEPATDVYAVGATALASLTGVEPETLPHQGLRVDVRAALGGRVSPALLTSLEQMVEPDPDRRASSLGAALDGIRHRGAELTPPPRGSASSPPPHASYPPHAWYPAPGHAPSAAPRDDAREDELVKSLRRLLWVLWGLGWILVPVVLGQLHAGRAVPVVMFGALAALLVVTWHKGALLRLALRRWARRSADGARRDLAAEAPRQRVDVGPAPPAQVRIHTSELQPEELVGQTERTSSPAEARQARLP
ncbi:MAG: serine/threonine protein kinase, partial [Labilithrix sp.]|nr:serine/threonine protein kinase [Labilithrix sp.]